MPLDITPPVNIDFVRRTKIVSAQEKVPGKSWSAANRHWRRANFLVHKLTSLGKNPASPHQRIALATDSDCDSFAVVVQTRSCRRSWVIYRTKRREPIPNEIFPLVERNESHQEKSWVKSYTFDSLKFFFPSSFCFFILLHYSSRCIRRSFAENYECCFTFIGLFNDREHSDTHFLLTQYRSLHQYLSKPYFFAFDVF